MIVIFQDQGTDFPPSTQSFATRTDAVEYVLNQVANVEPHRMEVVTVEDAKKSLASHNSFSMIAKNGSKYIWTIQ